MRALDPYAVGVEIASDFTGPELIALVQRATAAGSMMNIAFHGVGGDYLSVSTEACMVLLRYPAANRDIYWTDTFMRIKHHVKAQRVSSPQKSQ